MGAGRGHIPESSEVVPAPRDTWKNSVFTKTLRDFPRATEGQPRALRNKRPVIMRTCRKTDCDSRDQMPGEPMRIPSKEYWQGSPIRLRPGTVPARIRRSLALHSRVLRRYRHSVASGT